MEREPGEGGRGRGLTPGAVPASWTLTEASLAEIWSHAKLLSQQPSLGSGSAMWECRAAQPAPPPTPEQAT